MIEAALSETAEVLGGRLEGPDGRFRGVFHDTRRPLAGGLFAALRGERFDGGDFVAEAFRKGASGVLVEEGTAVPEGMPAIRVDDTLWALGRLASLYRERLGGRVVAVTGSIGKSSTRRLLASMLAGKVHEAPASYNNLLGVPLTLLSCPRDADFVLCEAGINAPGEMERLASILRPDAALLTSVAPVHLEGLGSLEGIASEKSRLLRAVRKGGFVVCGTGARLAERHLEGIDAAVVFPGDFGFRVRLKHVGGDGLGRYEIVFEGKVLRKEAMIAVPPGGGEDLLLTALEAAVRLGVEPEEAVRGAEERFRALPGRWETVKTAGRLVVNDAMNSNPEAAVKALSALVRIPLFPHVALLGDMLELGERSEEYHREVGAFAAVCGVKMLLATGESADSYINGFCSSGGEDAFRLEDPRGLGLAGLLERFVPEGGVLLVKGSHATGLHRLFER